MRKSLLAFCTLLLLIAPEVHAQQIVHPERGSALRVDLLDAARPVFARETNGQVEFVVRQLNVMNNWAFGDVRLQRPGGTPIDWTRTKYAEDLKAGMFDPSGSFFLARRTAAGWTVLQYATGPTDIAWDSWRLDYHLPNALFERCMKAGAVDEIAQGELAQGMFQDAAGRPEQAFILTLPGAVCLSGADETDNVKNANTIHLYTSNDALQKKMQRLVGGIVFVRGKPFGAITVHHHAPIVMDISEIEWRSSASADDNRSYAGPFTTQVLYTMCSQDNAISREKCILYIQGLIYGLNTQKSMQEQGAPVCLPAMSSETARVRILIFIEANTGGKPSNNKDGGDWMAFMGLAVGNICNK